MPDLSLEVANFTGAAWAAKMERRFVLAGLAQLEIQERPASQEEGRKDYPQQDVCELHVHFESQANIRRGDKQELESRSSGNANEFRFVSS